MNIKRKKLSAFLAGSLFGLSMQLLYWLATDFFFLPRAFESVMTVIILPGFYLVSPILMPILFEGNNGLSSYWLLALLFLGQMITYGTIFLLAYLAYSKFRKPTST